MKQFDTAARTWLHAAEFPRDLGSTFAKTIDDVTRHTQHMNADQLDAYGAAEFAKLKRVYGETLDSNLQAAGRMVEALEARQPGLKNLLKSNGIGDNALVASLLIQQAVRYHARRGR